MLGLHDHFYLLFCFATSGDGTILVSLTVYVHMEVARSNLWGNAMVSQQKVQVVAMRCMSAIGCMLSLANMGG